ncbi:MAG: tRNA pseudouridine(55) synthase TruB [Brevinematales bacterium]|jgi:tRNA pseudouridine55 synthase
MQKLNGVLPINKPSGVSSFDVIRILKKRLADLDWKKQKIGHGGTLDLPASGVLPILLGEASKAFDYLLLSKKEYRAVIQFGAVTDTDDAQGRVIETYEAGADLNDIEAVLPKFTGRIMQVPPLYSSLHINGQRSYDLARRNIMAAGEPREVEISGITIEAYDNKLKRLTIRVLCSSGTYIRSLARDIGRELSCGGHISELRRTMSAGIKLEDCIKPEEVDISSIEKQIIPLNKALTLPALDFQQDKDYIRSGRKLNKELFGEPGHEDGLYKIVAGGAVLAIVEKKGLNYIYLRVFND